MHDLLPFSCLANASCFLHRVFAIRSATFAQYMWCHTHDRLCETDQDSELEIAGLPCQGNSALGGLMKEEDPRFAVWLIFCFFQVWRGTLVFVIENVKVLAITSPHSGHRGKTTNYIMKKSCKISLGAILILFPGLFKIMPYPKVSRGEF